MNRLQYLTLQDIFPVNMDVLVPIRSCVLVEKSQCVHNFVDNCSSPNAAITDGNLLLPSKGIATNSRITS